VLLTRVKHLARDMGVERPIMGGLQEGKEDSAIGHGTHEAPAEEPNHFWLPPGRRRLRVTFCSIGSKQSFLDGGAASNP
jgi:hypothetical protein